jgi:hypothetical protein
MGYAYMAALIVSVLISIILAVFFAVIHRGARFMAGLAGILRYCQSVTVEAATRFLIFE